MTMPKVLAIIPARGGSKGLPGKNIRQLGGKPLIAWTIDASINSPKIAKTIVSTDCEKIASISEMFGADVPFMRPPELGTDNATTADVIHHAIDFLEENFDLIVILQPTSPFRCERDITKAIEIFQSTKASSVVSVCEAEKSPFWCFWRDEMGGITPILKDDTQFSRRQELRPAYLLNGAIYVVSVEQFMKDKKFIYDDTISYLMDKESSLDIDVLLDFKLAEFIIGEK